MEKSIENIPWKLEFDKEFEYEFNEFLNRLITKAHQSIMEQCPSYKEKYTEKSFLEDEFLENDTVREYYNNLVNRTDKTLTKAIFLLGMKTGMEIGK